MSARFTIVLAVLLVLVGGLLGVTQVLRTDSDAPERADRLYRVASSEIATVVLTQGSEAISFRQDPDDGWFVSEEGRDPSEVDVGRWGGIPSLLGGPAVSTNLSDSEEELGSRASYGLDPPRTVIDITTYDGQVTQVNLGVSTPTEDGFYAHVSGSEILYILHSSWVEVIERLLTEPPYPPESEL